MPSTLFIETVVNEGAQIYCERMGKGPLLLLIAGAMGDAGFYSSAAEILADQFTQIRMDYNYTLSLCITYFTDYIADRPVIDSCANTNSSNSEK